MKKLPFWKRPYGVRRVLDIGAGHNPFQGATHLLEIDLEEGRQRGMQKVAVPETATLTVGDVSALPYKTGSFDYIYASHVLEHVIDPRAACEEMMRVGAGGYVETPSPFLEQGLAMQDTQSPDQWIHKWFVLVTGLNQLVFEPKTLAEVQRFCSCSAGQFVKDFYGSVDFRQAQHCFPGSAKRTVLYWKSSFPVEVRTATADCRQDGRECRFVGMANMLLRSCSDVLRAARLLKLRRHYPDCLRVFRKYGHATLFVH